MARQHRDELSRASEIESRSVGAKARAGRVSRKARTDAAIGVGRP